MYCYNLLWYINLFYIKSGKILNVSLFQEKDGNVMVLKVFFWK